jgi:hypothetical protein
MQAGRNRLQNELASTPGFWNWYEPMQERMRQDPLIRFFNESWRTLVHKRGIRMSNEIRTSRFIGGLPMGGLVYPPAPPRVPGISGGGERLAGSFFGE